MESEEAKEKESAQVNSKVCWGLFDSKAKQPPIMLLILTLPNLQPTLNIPRWDGLSSCILFGVNQG